MMPKEIYLETGVEEVETSSIIETSTNSSSISMHPRKRKRRSEIWNHFIKVNQNNGARCHYCSHILSFAAGSLSNLLRHLRNKHPSVAANFRYRGPPNFCNSRDVVDILKVEGANGEREIADNEIKPSEKYTSDLEDVDYSEKRRRTSGDTDIESHFKRDHSYGEKPHWKNEQLFGQFIQSEVNKFKNELLMRQCKREILQVLIKFQQAEDDLYSPADSSVLMD